MKDDEKVLIDRILLFRFFLHILSSFLLEKEMRMKMLFMSLDSREFLSEK